MSNFLASFERRRVRPNIGAIMAGVVLASCAGGDTATSVESTLDYSDLMADGNCQGGAPRPCFAPLRAEPNFGSDPLNISINDSGNVLVQWPYEGSDLLEVVCLKEGDEVSTADGSRISSDWAGIEVPVKEPYLSEQTVASINEGSLDLTIAADDTAVIVYTPALWLAEDISALPVC
jgi:hypothetical protein